MVATSTSLVQALNQYPELWVLTPVGYPNAPADKAKAPYRPNWQSEEPIHRSQLANIAVHGEMVTYTKDDGSTYQTARKPTGWGVRSGPISGGLLLVDFDGAAALTKFVELSGGIMPPVTLGFTSCTVEGLATLELPQRFQLAFQVPEKYWSAMKNRRVFKTGVFGPDAKEQILELRWDGCQSVLPSSLHPSGRIYSWLPGRHSTSVTIASADSEEWRWLIEALLEDSTEATTAPPCLPLSDNTDASSQEIAIPERLLTSGSRLHSRTPLYQGYQDIAIPVPSAVPLTACVPKADRELIERGLPKGSGRNDAAIKLGLNLVATEQHLRSINQHFTESASLLLETFCQRSGMTQKETEERLKWVSDKKNPSPSLSPDAIENCIRAWYWNNYVKPNQPELSSGSRGKSNGGKVGVSNSGEGSASTGGGGCGGGNSLCASGGVDESGHNPHSNNLYHDVAKIVGSSYSPAKQSAALMEYAYESGYPLAGLEKLAREIEAQFNRKETTSSDALELSKLIDYRQQRLDIERILPQPLAKALLSKSNSDRLDPVYFWQWLLPAAGTELGGNIGLRGKEGEIPADDWVEFAIFWTMVVALPSAGKSQSLKAIFAPMRRRQKKAKVEYKKQLTKLKELEAAWQKLSPDERDKKIHSPTNPAIFKAGMSPPPGKQFIEVGSPEGAMKRMSALPSKAGCAFAFDELIRLLMLDQYKDKGGDTRQILMQTFNGPSDLEFERAKENESFEFNDICLNITGAVQPAKFKKLAADPDDGDGFISRMLPAIPSTPDNFAVWSDSKVAIDLVLDNLYDHLRLLHGRLRELLPQSYLEPDENGVLPPVVLRFTKEASECWQKWWMLVRRCMLSVEQDNPALFGFLGKMLSYTLRIALILHCMDLAYYKNPSPLEVGIDPLNRAIEAVKFHIGQYRLLQSKNSEGASIPGRLAQIHDYALRKGKEVSAVQVQNGVFRRIAGARKPSLAEIRQDFIALAANGHAVTLGEDKDLLLKAIPFKKDVGIPTSYDKNSDNLKIAVTSINKEVQPAATENSDNSDNFAHHLKTDSDNQLSTNEDNQKHPMASSDSVVLLNPTPGGVNATPVEWKVDLGDDTTDQNCRNCRNNDEGQPSNQESELFVADEELSEDLSEDVGNSDNLEDAPDGDPDDDPDDDPPLGGGNVPKPNTPSGDNGGGNESISSDAAWLMGLLDDLESQPQPIKRFTSIDQLVSLFQEAESRALKCLDKLMQLCPDYWKRASVAIGTISELLSEDDSKDNLAYVPMLTTSPEPTQEPKSEITEAPKSSPTPNPETNKQLP